MSQIIPKVDAAALASVAALAGDNIITEDELSLSRSGTQGGFSFDGSNDYLEGPIDDFGTSDFSLVFDILWDDAPSGVEFFANKSGGNNRWYFYATATQYILSIVDNGGATNTYTWTITPSVNHRSVIITADRSANATLYLNGESQGTQDISAQSAVDLGSGNTNPARIGFSTSSIDGKMFQVRYYNTLKTAGQVLNLAKGQNDTDSLWLHLSPTSTEDNLWVDISGNQRSFSNNGATRIESRIGKRYISDSEYTTYRKLDGGYRTDGAGSHLAFPDNISYVSGGTDLPFSGIVSFKRLATGTQYILNKYGGSFGVNRHWVLMSSDTHVQLTIYDAQGDYIAARSSQNLTVGEEYTLTYSYSGNNSSSNITLYLNGVKIPTTDNSSGAYGGTFNGDHPIWAGKLSFTTYTEVEINEARIFNYALSDADVKSYSRGAATKWVDRVSSSGSIHSAAINQLDESWTDSGTASLSSGTATYDGGGGAIVYDGGVPLLNKNYRVTVTVGAYTSGSLRVILGDSGTTYDLAVDRAGDFVIEGVADGTNDNLTLYGYGGTGNFNGTVTDVVVEYIGELAHYAPESATTSVWEDCSGLDNHAVNDGAELLKPQLQETYTTNQELVSSRVGRGPAYYFDGTNDSIGDIDEAAINSNDFTWAVDINPADDAGNYGVIYGLGSGAFTNRRYLRYNAGKYDLTIGDSSATVLEVEWPAQKANVIVTHDSATSTAKLYIDGKLIKEKVHTNQFDVATSPMSNNVMDIGSLGAGTYFKGEISKVAIFNRALTAAEVELVSRGQSLGYSDKGADGTALESSDFSAGTDSYLTLGGAVVGDVDSVGGENDTLRFTLDGTTGGHGVYKDVGTVEGKRYRVTGKYYIPSTNSDVTGIAFYFGFSNRTVIYSLAAAPTNTWVDIEAEVVCGETYSGITNPERVLIYALNSSGFTTITDAGADDVFYLKGIAVTPIGEVLKFLPESAATARWYNEGGAGSSADGTVVGATLINERKRGVFDNLYLDNVPSSDAGLIAGEIYRDNNGHLKIVI